MIEQGNFFTNFIEPISNFFEEIILINGFILVMALLLYIALRISENRWKQNRTTYIQRSLLVTVAFGELVLMALMGYVFWNNYEKPAVDMQFVADIDPDTRWVKNSTEVYYIMHTALNKINADGSEYEVVYEDDNPIKEFHFSPDGNSILILTKNKIILHDRITGIENVIDEIKPEQEAKGSVSGIRWSPDSSKFVYNAAKWSRVSSIEGSYIYHMANQKTDSFKSPQRRLSSLYWDLKGENIYSFHHDSEHGSDGNIIYRLKVFKIPVSTLVPELIDTIATEQKGLPLKNLDMRGINLYMDSNDLSFGIERIERIWDGDFGVKLGIDEDDHLYFVKNEWFKKRLFKLSRVPDQTNFPHYQYQGGDLALQQLKWLPGGQYAVLRHSAHGILILEPETKRIGSLVPVQGHSFGWYN